MTPVRIQLRRVKGWKMPPNTVSVARPTKWGNPYRVGADESYYGGPDCVRATAQQCVDLFRNHIEAMAFAERVSTAELLCELRGKNLACFCPLPESGEPDVCHARILLELSNA